MGLVINIDLGHRTKYPPGIKEGDFVRNIRHIEEALYVVGPRFGLHGTFNLTLGDSDREETSFGEWGGRRRGKWKGVDFYDIRPFNIVLYLSLEPHARDEFISGVLLEDMKAASGMMGWDTVAVQRVITELREQKYQLRVEISKAAKFTKSRRFQARVYATVERENMGVIVEVFNRTGEFVGSRKQGRSLRGVHEVEQHCRKTYWWNRRFIVKGTAIWPPWIFDFTDTLPEEDLDGHDGKSKP